MYSATENRSLPKRRRSTLQLTGSCSPVDLSRISDEAARFGELIHDRGDRLSRRRAELSDETRGLSPENRELHALGWIADRREVLSDLHMRFIEARGDKSIDICATGVL